MRTSCSQRCGLAYPFRTACLDRGACRYTATPWLIPVLSYLPPIMQSIDLSAPNVPQAARRLQQRCINPSKSSRLLHLCLSARPSIYRPQVWARGARGHVARGPVLACLGDSRPRGPRLGDRSVQARHSAPRLDCLGKRDSPRRFGLGDQAQKKGRRMAPQG